MKRKLTFIILGSILVSYLLMIIFSAINIRNIGLKSAEDKAKITAELVKDGLTSHMVSGIMENRAYYLKKIENSPNIKSLWVTRSQSVKDQFGEGFSNETPRDAIDKDVILTAQTYKKVYETSNEASLRITIPYIATQHGEPNCMKCHDAKEGDVLGTISMVVDISETRFNGFVTSLIIFVVTIFIMIAVSFIINHYMKPVLKLFESITYVMGKAKDGDYSKRVQNVDDGEDYKNVVFWVNSLLDKLQDTVDEIENTVKEFLTDKNIKETDVLIELKELVREISNIHKFKKTIEFDEDKIQIYKRIGTILENNINIKDFVIVESDKKSKISNKTVYISSDFTMKDINPQCRALRTKQIVNSTQFSGICDGCNNTNDHYICIPYTISNDLEIMIHVTTKDKENVQNVHDNLPRINDYINEARPEIVSKNLTEILRISSTTDPLTGLFNRKYLDEYIDKAIAQAKRTNSTYGVMMIDIDYFKMVNDTYGHDIGDRVIKMLSKTLSKSIREADIAFRFGGEEFLVLLYNCDSQKVEEIAQKIRLAFEAQNIEANDGKIFKKTLSIGTSLYPSDTDSIWKAIKYADISLYKAKESGRNKVVAFKRDFLDKSGIAEDF